MADQRKEIKFHKSMTADKRNENFAYSAKNIPDIKSQGLYPACGFTEPGTIPADADIIDIAGWVATSYTPDKFPKVIVRSNGKTRFYEIRGSSEVNTAIDDRVDAVATGSDGIYIATEGNEIVSPLYQNTNTVTIATFPSSSSVDVGGFDGLYYWWIGDKIWRQLAGSSVLELIMDNTGLRDPYFLDFYKDYSIIYDQTHSSSSDGTYSTIVYFHDKKDSAFFSKRLVYKNERLLAGGVLDNLPVLVTQKAHSQNAKESRGQIIVRAYNGEEFVFLNSIKANEDEVSAGGSEIKQSGCKVNGEYMIFSVTDNDQGDGDPTKELAKNHIYKVFKDGSIQILTTPSIDSARPDSHHASAVGTFFDFDAYGMDNVSTYPARVFYNRNTNRTNTNYTGFETTYITNFLCNPYNEHTLTAISLSFEKLFNAEELDIYYRTSDKESFVLLANITRQKVKDNVNKRIDQGTADPTPSQRYQITKMPDGTALPEFNEIQFKFVSKKGFSIIGSWFEYDYITRNTKK